MKISEAKTLLTSVFNYNIAQMTAGADHKSYLLPFFRSDPGVGKTALTRQVAQELSVYYHLTIVAQYDAGELAGLPFKNEVILNYERDENGDYLHDDEGQLIPIYGTRMTRLRPSYMPDPAKEDGLVGVWNFDELPQAPLANLNICAQLFNQWRIGEHEISPGITMCATGNKPEHKAGVTMLPTHLKDRVMFIDLEVDHGEFMAYAAAYGLNPRVRGYLNKYQAHLHEFKVGADAFRTPRSWEKVSNILSLNLPTNIQLEAMAGQIGVGESTEFNTYLTETDKLPDPMSVIMDPDNAPVFGPDQVDLTYLLLINLADMATPKNVKNQIKYIRRIPEKEFGALWVKQATSKHKELDETKEITDFKLTDVSQML